jgi:DNA gyrase subunit A
MSGYEMIFHPNHGEWEFTHRLADDYNLSAGVYSKDAGKVRHHIDFNKLNNSPENIRRMQWLDHWRLHSNFTSSKHKNDPEYVAKLAKGRDAFWNNKANRQAYSERISAKNKENWQNPEYREKMRAFLSEVNIQYIKAHPEVREKMSRRATKTLKRLWQDSAYRSFMREKIIKGNKNHTTNLTGKKKFDAICKSVLDSGDELSLARYEKARQVLYPYGAATLWETGLEKYYGGDVNRIKIEAVSNHKVGRVVFTGEKEDVYDLTINGTHNFALAAGVFVHNSIDGDGAAAPRYTEAKMSRLSEELLRDIGKETVDWRPNYENNRREPVVLPAVVPNLLLNGTLGIAVGMATNIPPHNLREVVGAVTHVIDNPDATTKDLLEFIKGPDFPTGGIAFDQKDIEHAYANGKGGVVVRGETEIVEDKKGNFQIVISSIPFRVNKAELIKRIADLVHEKKLEGVRDLRDESTKDIRVVVELKSGAQPQTVLNYIYKHTQLEETFHYNCVALVDGVPQTLSLKGLLDEFVGHRKEVVRRRTEFDLARAQEREHILLGLKKALDHIDAIIKLIRAAKDVPAAHAELKKKFSFSDAQATAILEMRLQKLAGLERQKVEDELDEIQKLIKELEALLKSPQKILSVIKGELAGIADKYGDDRRTKIVKGGVKNISVEDMIPDEESVLVLTSGGYIKRTNPSEYKKQKRGGVGVIDLNTKEEDFVTRFLTASTHADLLFFSDKGKAYQIKMYEVPEGRRATKGKSIMNFLSLTSDEHVTSVLAMPKDAKKEGLSLLLITKDGVAKRVSAESFYDVRRSGLIAIKLSANDQLIAAMLVGKKDEVALVSCGGQSIRFKVTDIREMGRGAAGVRAMKLGKGDSVVSAGAALDSLKGEDPQILVLSEIGYGKRTRLKDYKVQKRGGSGIKTAKLTSKTGKVIASRVIYGTDGELVVVSKKGQVIRVDLKEIPALGRQTQGVRIMKLRAGDMIAALIIL